MNTTKAITSALLAVAASLTLSACEGRTNADLSAAQYLVQSGTPTERASAIGSIEDMANAGDREAQEWLALEFELEGSDLPKDEERATYWFYRAAMNKSPRASHQMAMRYALNDELEKGYMYLFLPSQMGVDYDREGLGFKNASEALSRLMIYQGRNGFDVGIDLAAACAANGYESCDPEMDAIAFEEMRFQPVAIDPKSADLCVGDYCPCDRTVGFGGMDQDLCTKLTNGEEINPDLLRMAKDARQKRSAGQ